MHNRELGILIPAAFRMIASRGELEIGDIDSIRRPTSVAWRSFDFCLSSLSGAV